MCVSTALLSTLAVATREIPCESEVALSEHQCFSLYVVAHIEIESTVCKRLITLSLPALTPLALSTWGLILSTCTALP